MRVNQAPPCEADQTQPAMDSCGWQVRLVLIQFTPLSDSLQGPAQKVMSKRPVSLHTRCCPVLD